MQTTSLHRVERVVLYGLLAALFIAGVVYANLRRGHTSAPLADGEVRAVSRTDVNAEDAMAGVEAAGVRVCPIEYAVPFPHQIVFRLEQYVHGQRANDGSISECSLNGKAGQGRLRLVTKTDGKQLSVWFSNGGGVGGATVPVAGYDATSSGVLQTRLVEGQTVPLYVYAANHRNIRGFTNTESVEKIIDSYEMVIVITAELQRAPQ